MASGSGWNLWVWLVDVAVRRYIDFLILLIPTPLISGVFFAAASLLFVHFLNVFRSLYNYTDSEIIVSTRWDSLRLAPIIEIELLKGRIIARNGSLAQTQ